MTPLTTPAVDKKRLLLIVNPVSGKKAIVRHIPSLLACFQNAGYITTALVTQKRGDACEFAGLYGSSHDMIVCTGGDGTLNEVVSGLVKHDVRIPVGYIPCGSTNDFAKTHGLPVSIPAAAKAAVSGRVRDYDIGLLNGRVFNYVAAFGTFTWLSYTTDQNLKNVLGHAAYIIDGVREVNRIRPYRMRITADDAVYEGEFLFGAICNSTSVAGVFTLPEEEVDTDDGILELLLIRRPKTIFELNPVIVGLIEHDYSSENVVFTHCRSIRIENLEGAKFTLDGERGGNDAEMHIGVVHDFLELAY